MNLGLNKEGVFVGGVSARLGGQIKSASFQNLDPFSHFYI